MGATTNTTVEPPTKPLDTAQAAATPDLPDTPVTGTLPAELALLAQVSGSSAIDGGFAGSSADSYGQFTLNAGSIEDATFSFSWDYSLSAGATPFDSGAGAFWEISDVDGLVDLGASISVSGVTGPFTRSADSRGTFDIAVAQGSTNTVYFTASANGYAAPEPSVIALFALGLTGLGAARRRRVVA